MELWLELLALGGSEKTVATLGWMSERLRLGLLAVLSVAWLAGASMPVVEDPKAGFV